MALRIINYPPKYQPLNSTSSSSSSQLPLSFLRSPPPTILPFNRTPLRFNEIRCSISQIHSYGTVDYEKRPALKWSSLYRRIATMQNPDLGSGVVLDEWDRDEKRRLSKWFLCRVARELRKFRRFKLALENSFNRAINSFFKIGIPVYEWMTSQGDRFMFNSSDMAIQLDLISKVHGISHAEEYFSTLSDEQKDKRTYGALLNAYGKAKLKEKSEALFETMKARGFVTDALPFNVMMTLYMNLGEHEKVNATLNEMKEKNVRFDMYTYNIWITNCASLEDIEAMERVVEGMISDGSINPNWTTYGTLATMYIKAGNFEKAEICLKEVELRVTGRDRTPFNYLLGYYSSIGKREEVYRIWKWYKSTFPSILNLGYQAVLSSLVRLDDIGKAEAIFNEWFSTTSNYDPRICHILMGWYARNALVNKAKIIVDRLIEKGGKPKPTTWEILAEGYINEKRINEASSCLKNAASDVVGNKWRPKPANVANILGMCKEMNKMDEVDSLVDVLRNKGWLEEDEFKSLISV